MAAIDHPENYLALFDPDVANVGTAEVVESKLELIAGMAAESTAVLVDPVWSFGQSVLSATVPPSVGMISGLELLAYSPAGFGTETVLRDGWTWRRWLGSAPTPPSWSSSTAASARRSPRRSTTWCARLVADCARHQVPLVVEPLWYPLEGETLDDPATREARVEATVQSAATFAELGADIIKTEFPGYVDTEEDRQRAAEACARLDAAVDVPWVLLSASATYEQFREQVRIAASAGACGFMAGRAIWGDAVGRFSAERRQEGVRTAASRLRELHEVLREHGHGWQTPVPVADTVEAVTPGWFASK